VATPSAAAATPSPTAPPEPITLTWWDYFGYSPASDQAVVEMIEAYQASHANVTIERTAIGFGDFATKLTQAASTGTFPDIAALDNADVPGYAAQGALADLSEYEANWATLSNFLPAVGESVKYDGKFFGAPFRSNTTVLFYDADALAAAGLEPPTTWDELRSTAQALTQDRRSGFCFAAPPWEEATFTFLPFVWQAGGDLTTFGDDASIAALDLINTFVNVDKSAPKSVLEWGQSAVAEQFAGGNCAMMVNGPWVLGTTAQASFEVGLTPWPSGSAGSASPLGGEVWVVGANSEHVAAVWELIDWLSQPANTLPQIAGGLSSIPNRTDVADDPAWDWDPAVSVFAEQMPDAHTRAVYGPNYPKMSEAVWTAVQEVLTGKMSSADAAAAAAAKIAPLLP
jgi:multiple sugar transport system substrate-binding protein